MLRASQRAPEGEIKPSSRRRGRIDAASMHRSAREWFRETDLGHSHRAWMAVLKAGQSVIFLPRSST